ncbi:hypothetical protein ACPOL_1044 [Acidisarcina polymorpha]|uniref:Uncharacterized protein n=1 Tax=Acidisarcina polymorpha TaxID=2211140 RepID=A0A2Z5FVK5_9BACT|nr:hypothetical protein ACPOL_1044 [Acidisarcina polymorpha]
MLSCAATAGIARAKDIARPLNAEIVRFFFKISPLWHTWH